MANVRPNGVNTFLDNNGFPLAGGMVYTYASGTTTPKQTFADAAETTPKSNPIILDSAGRATVFWSGAYAVIVKDSTGVLIDSVDPLSSALTGTDFTALNTVTLPGAYQVSAAGQHTAALFRSANQVVLSEDVTTSADSLGIGSDHVAHFVLNGLLTHLFGPNAYTINSDNGVLGFYNSVGSAQTGFIQATAGGPFTIEAQTGAINLISMSGATNIQTSGAQPISFYTSGTLRGGIDANGALGLNSRGYFNQGQVTAGVGLGRLIIQAGGSPPADGMEGDICLIY